MEEADWMEAFACHPRIGERKAAHASAQSAAWSQQEQSSRNDAAERVLAELAEGNALYEQRFGFTYIVCATGKSAEEMLAILKRRLASDRAGELREAAEQQRQITQIRLGKWLDAMSAITTHVLDAVLGKPAAGISVRLEQARGRMAGRARSTRARPMRTDAAAIWRRDAAPGVYRLTFDTGAYLARNRPREHLSGDLHHLQLRRRGALSPAAAVERQQLHNLSRKLTRWQDWVRIATENRACACRASRGTATVTSSTSGPCTCCCEGDFESSFTEADNSKILPTDTMKNTVYFVARDSKAATIEEFAMELGDYLLSNNPQVSKASVEIEEKAWERMVIDGAPEADDLQARRTGVAHGARGARPGRRVVDHTPAWTGW